MYYVTSNKKSRKGESVQFHGEELIQFMTKSVFLSVNGVVKKDGRFSWTDISTKLSVRDIAGMIILSRTIDDVLSSVVRTFPVKIPDLFLEKCRHLYIYDAFVAFSDKEVSEKQSLVSTTEMLQSDDSFVRNLLAEVGIEEKDDDELCCMTTTESKPKTKPYSFVVTSDSVLTVMDVDFGKVFSSKDLLLDFFRDLMEALYQSWGLEKANKSMFYSSYLSLL